MKELKFRISNPIKFNTTLNGFLRKFNNLDRSILIKLYPDHMISTMSNIQKSVIKYVNMDLSDVIEPLSEWDGAIYLPLMVSDKLTKVLNFFNTDTEMTIVYDSIEEKNVALTIHFKSESLNMELIASKISLFKLSVQITDNILERLVDVSDKLYEIELNADVIENLKSLSNTNINDEIFIESNERGVFFIGDTFELKLSEPIGVNNRYGFSRNNIKNLDQLNYNLYVMEDKGVFVSTNDMNTVIISKLIEG